VEKLKKHGFETSNSEIRPTAVKIKPKTQKSGFFLVLLN